MVGSSGAVIEVVACTALCGRLRFTLASPMVALTAVVAIPILGTPLDVPAMPIAVCALSFFSLGRYVGDRRTLLGFGVILVGVRADYHWFDGRAHNPSDVVFVLVHAGARTRPRENVRRPPPRHGLPAELAVLTEREREVFGLIARGLSNEDIRTTLVISEATVKTHINRILAKLGATSRVQLVVLGYETGTVRPGEGVLPATSARRP